MHVLVVVSDADVRSALRDVLTDAGYVVSTAADRQTARAVLRGRTQPLVVLLDTPDMDIIDSPAPCAYVLLTTDPDQVPPPFNSRAMQRLVPVVAMPFEMDVLLAAVAAAAARLDGEAVHR
jgi:DNA-binding NtrC family response regulator